MMRVVGAVLCAVLLAGCEVVTFGDSNTCGWLTGCAGDRFYWPERMAADPRWPLGWSVVNRGIPGMSAGDYGVELQNGEPTYAGFHLDRVLDTDLAHACVPIWRLFARRKLVLAVGTNDLRAGHPTPDGIALKIGALRDRVLRAKPCLDVYVATIPPRQGVDEAFRARVNEALGRHVPPERLVPFGDPPGGPVALAADGVHLTAAGHDVRAHVALAVLFPDR